MANPVTSMKPSGGESFLTVAFSNSPFALRPLGRVRFSSGFPSVFTANYSRSLSCSLVSLFSLRSLPVSPVALSNLCPPLYN